MLRISQVRLRPGEPVSSLPARIADRLRIEEKDILFWEIRKESVDARDKSAVRFIYTVDFSVKDEEKLLRRAGRQKNNHLVRPADKEYAAPRSGYEGTMDYAGERPVIVGFGPCGMFAGLILAGAGLKPVIVERGRRVEQRTEDVEHFWKTGELDERSNVQFGEGGAGTFSDGKLTTGTKDFRIGRVIGELIEAGADPSIAYKHMPHVGTDVLRSVVRKIREKIIAQGGEFYFDTAMKGIRIEDDVLTGIYVEHTDRKRSFSTASHRDNPEAGSSSRYGSGNSRTASYNPEAGSSCRSDSGNSGKASDVSGSGEEAFISCGQLVLAPGNGARDTFEMLYDKGVRMEAKPFSVGVRIEHPQTLINYAQYGDVNDSEGRLSAAVYKLAHHCAGGRGVYTFCMCPGGYVVGAASEQGGVVTNGMSYFARDGSNANSALLVSVTPEDCYRETGENHPLAGMWLQRKLEENAFQLGGGGFRAPVQRLGDFLRTRGSSCAEMPEPFSGSGESRGDNLSKNDSSEPVEPTYLPGIAWKDLHACLPSFVTEAMEEAIPEMARKLRGFDLDAAVMTGVETRSSSPVRILRDPDTLESPGIRGLYPGGEGAGYAGGIVSSAVDGIRIAEKIIRSISEEDL